MMRVMLFMPCCQSSMRVGLALAASWLEILQAASLQGHCGVLRGIASIILWSI